MNIVGKRHDKHARRVNRTWKRQCVIGNFLKAERAVIGRISDQDDGFRTLAPGCFDRDPDQLATDTTALVRGTDGQRSQQMSLHPTGDDRRHSH